MRINSMIKLLGIVAKTKSGLATEAVSRLVAWLKERGLEYIIDTESAKVANITSGVSKVELIKEADLIVVLGGDGTFLGVARMMDGRQVPILGINLGGLGFLTEFAYEEMLPALEKVVEGDYVFEDRIMLDTDISREGKKVASFTALNDIVITRGALARMVNIKVLVSGIFLNNYTADGLIVSTPTGSTAYNLSAGGPIVHPAHNAIIISPICPHTLTNRPIVIPDSVDVELSLDDDHSGEAVVTVDGQVGFQLSVRDVIVVRRSKDITRIIQSPHKNYYQLLRGKLKWGETIRNENRG